MSNQNNNNSNTTPNTNTDNQDKRKIRGSEWTSTSRLKMTVDPFSKADWDPAERRSTITLPPTKISAMSAQLEAMDKQDTDREPTEHEVKWGQAVIEAANIGLSRDALSSAAEDKKSLWEYGPDYNGQRIVITSPTMKKPQGEELTGTRALLAISHTLGIGDMIQVPLWHSGFRITLKPPTESRIVELFRKMEADTISVGRATGGLIYSNISVVLVDEVVDFIIEHIHSCSIIGWKELDLRKLIKTQDLFPITAAMAATIYPKGFSYKRPCISNPEECTHIVEGKVDIRKLLYTNKTALTNEQKAHMAISKPDAYGVDDVRKYQSSLHILDSSTAVIDEEKGLELILSSPTLDDYIEVGNSWINGIETMVEEALGEENIEKRKELSDRFANASILRQYAQWVSEIKIDGNTIKDRRDIDEAMAMLSGVDVYRENITKSIVDYISKSVVSMVGVPAYDCPACGKDQSDPNAPPGFKTLIPLDTLLLFFYLMAQKHIQIALRQQT